MRNLRQTTHGTTGRILDLLRRGPRTVDELARELDLTRTAVRAQLASLLRDGLAEQRGSRRGTSKPSHVYGVTSQAELLFSRAISVRPPSSLSSALAEATRSPSSPRGTGRPASTARPTSCMIESNSGEGMRLDSTCRS